MDYMMNETKDKDMTASAKVYPDLRIKINLHTDPADGWIAVKRKMLAEYGIAENISPYSYQKGQTVYLEENHDAPKLIAKLASHGIVVDWVWKKSDRPSRIRSYQRYSV